MQPVGRPPEDGIPRRNRLTFDNFILFHHADDKTHQVIVILGRVKTGHLSGFTPDKGAADIFAGAGQSLHNRRYLFRYHLAQTDVIEEENRLRSTGKYVVDAVTDDVNPDGIMLVEGIGQLCLRSHLVDTGYQHRVIVPFELIHSPEKPTPLKTSGRSVDFTSWLILRTALSLALMSTPALA